MNIMLNQRKLKIDRAHGAYPARSVRGFTLIEILVVMVIIGILGVYIVPKVMDRPDEARVISAQQGISALESALRMYKMDNHRYPTTEQGLRALLTKPTISPIPANWRKGGYIDKLPKDPWGNPYQYLQPGLHGDIDVFSYGGDGVAGGKGNDADIGNWEQ